MIFFKKQKKRFKLLVAHNVNLFSHSIFWDSPQCARGFWWCWRDDLVLGIEFRPLVCNVCFTILVSWLSYFSKLKVSLFISLFFVVYTLSSKSWWWLQVWVFREGKPAANFLFLSWLSFSERLLFGEGSVIEVCSVSVALKSYSSPLCFIIRYHPQHSIPGR